MKLTKKHVAILLIAIPAAQMLIGTCAVTSWGIYNTAYAVGLDPVLCLDYTINNTPYAHQWVRINGHNIEPMTYCIYYSDRFDYNDPDRIITEHNEIQQYCSIQNQFFIDDVASPKYYKEIWVRKVSNMYRRALINQLDLRAPHEHI